MTPRLPPLLLLLTLAEDPQRVAVGPALAAAAARAGWAFEVYADERRRGRHYGGGDPGAVPEGWAAGSLVVGGGHVEQALWLAASHEVVVVGDPRSLLWPVMAAAGAELLPARGPAAVYGAALERLGQPVPHDVLVVDHGPQGPHQVQVAPYLYPEFLDGPPALGLEVSADPQERDALLALGARRFCGRWLDPSRAAAFGPLDDEQGQVAGQDWAGLTTALAERHGGWARGFLLGDPGLVAAQLGRAAARRLLPLYSQPQTVVVERARALLVDVGGTVFGRQYDDHDFFALAPLGHGLQLVDPGPPFEALRARAVALRGSPVGEGAVPAPPAVDGVSDEQLSRWADEGRVLTTLLFWSGMVRELECVPRIVDLVATSGLKAGLVLTTAAVEQSPRPPVSLLAEPLAQGGVAGHLELLLGSMGDAVAPEALLPPGALEAALRDSRRRLADLLPESLVPQGWWPILDAPLSGPLRGRVRMELGRPVVRLPPRRPGGGAPPAPDAAPQVGGGRDLRARVGAALRRAGAERLLEQDRPFSWRRPTGPDLHVARAVQSSGFSYMWSKAGFGTPRLVHRAGDFVSLPLTAGVWGGWTPFYTVDGLSDLVAAERRLLRAGTPGWLAGTLDSPLWLDSGEVFSRGAELFRMAEWLLAGGSTGRLVNATPRVVARYARLLADRALVDGHAA